MTSARLQLAAQPKRALVTGGAGYFGGILGRFLSDRGIEVVSLDRLDDPEPDPRIAYTKADLRRRDEVQTVFQTHGPFNSVFHCAAIMGHEIPDPQELMQNNAAATQILAEVCIGAGVRKVVYTSSICVFGRSYYDPVSEDEPVCPVEPYGLSKLEGERILASYSGKLESDALRCPTIVSAGRLGLLAIFFEFVREGRRVYLVGDGSNRYQFIYALDLAEACLLAARAPGSHIYNVGSDDVKPLRDVYATVIKEAGSHSRLVKLPAWPVTRSLSMLFRLGLSPLGPYHSRLISGTFIFDTNRIKKDLGWRPTRTNEEILCEAYRFYSQNDARRSAELSAHRQGAKMGVLRLVKWLS